MAKIEQKYIFEGEPWTPEFAGKGFTVYLSEAGQEAIICDASGEVLCRITAKASQNEGFLSVTNE